MSAQKEEENVQHFSCPYPVYKLKIRGPEDISLPIGNYHLFYIPSLDVGNVAEVMLPCGRLVTDKRIEGFMEIGSIIGGLLDRYKVVFYLGIGILHKRLTCLS